MAIDLCSETSGTGNNPTISPRISFSHDFPQSDPLPVEQLLRSLSSSSSSPASMADELFSDGKILPTQFKPPLPLPPQLPAINRIQPQPPVVDDEYYPQSSSKSFWGFKRSSSCGNGYARSLCPIPLLSRSNSTGSAASSKRSKEGYLHKHHSSSNLQNQKPPLRRTGYSYGNSGNAGNGVRVNPVLNLGFGSFFSNGKKK